MIAEPNLTHDNYTLYVLRQQVIQRNFGEIVCEESYIFEFNSLYVQNICLSISKSQESLHQK